jgi:hypothetical protein
MDKKITALLILFVISARGMDTSLSKNNGPFEKEQKIIDDTIYIYDVTHKAPTLHEIAEGISSSAFFRLWVTQNVKEKSESEKIFDDFQENLTIFPLSKWEMNK